MKRETTAFNRVLAQLEDFANFHIPLMSKRADVKAFLREVKRLKKGRK